MRSSVDLRALRAEIRRHAVAAGVELPESALAELAGALGREPVTRAMRVDPVAGLRAE